MTTSVASPMIIRFFKLWTLKQKAWVQAKKEQISTELQLMKARVQPNFLFSALNSIHSFSTRRSPQTPDLILKLSSLLSYMLYDCKTEEVLMEKEVEVIKNYIDLEKERLGNRVDISLNIEGDIQGKYITPLLILPFLENAFKHGTAKEIERPWMSVDIAVKDFLLQYKVVNSKNELAAFQQNGTGIGNVKKRLEILYPGKHGLKLTDQGDFFVASLWINLDGESEKVSKATLSKNDLNIYSYEIAMSAGR
jgi:LytS/YehU family sensor histidine kinase